MSDFSNQISFPGEVNVLQAEILTTKGKTIDIINFMVDLSMYEDIFSNTMSGFIILQDSIDIINNAPLIGEELLNITLATPTLSTKISKSFYIYKLEKRIINKRSQIYQLHFCSRELIFSTNTKISKAFSGNISDNIDIIFKNEKYLASKSTLVMDKTKNSYSFISAYWNPLETINWLTTRSINSNGVSNYLFFENNQEFSYISVDKLMQSQPKREYIYSDVGSNTIYGAKGDKESKYNIVKNLESGVVFDYLRNISGGLFASKLYTYDLTTKNINSNTFDYIGDFDKSSHLEKYPLKSDNLFRKKNASLYFIEKNNYQTGTFKMQGYKDFYLQRNSLMEQLSAFKMTIEVHGRTDIKAGDVVSLDIIENRQLTKDNINNEGKSEYFSGKYLITAIRHQILSGVHSMTLEIVSDSFLNDITNK